MPGPQIMLVGSHHLANNNRDLINLPIEDVLTPGRQQEIEQLVDGLAEWRPTRIAIEWARTNQSGLDRRYADYLSGELSLTANERDQIGLRLAKKLGHRQVYAIDWNESAPGDPGQYDFIAWANQHGQEDRFGAFVRDGQAEADRIAGRMREQSVGQWYSDLNSPEAREQAHRPYFEIASFGSDGANPGAAWVGAWYARNLRIFNNLREVLGPGERVLVLYGSGHAYLLERFIKESGAGVTIDARDYIQDD
ncbi:hypothetical protein PK98_15070 [Croceibacterium mercuriale]|uniref:Haem-binding uptake Tiki superfamily ChaN domain-containing protein n=2 Tax=Croceibacterium mercuriale TaxID=1572751 RepID=A0A0B2BWE4_9SPHN|nr:hypothetical protein PK98_15070 [Croceibacterium mercuriale]